MSEKVCVITGGTRGIGFATVEAFLNAGYRVIFYGSRQETVDKAMAALNNNPMAKGLWSNIQDPEAIEADMKAIHDEFGSIDVLINNAGISDSTPFDSYTKELFEKVLDLNVVAPYVMTRAAVPYMKEQGHGVILNTSSMVSKNGQPAGLAYPVSKYAVNGMTISLARELGRFGIRVNAVAPGITMTDMVKALPDKMIQPMIQAVPLKRIGEAQDIANAFLFLASDAASYISGAVLPVDGVMSA